MYSLAVRLDHALRASRFVGWYLEGQIDHGFALTGHRAQGIIIDRIFRNGRKPGRTRAAYVVMSVGRDANTP